MELRILVYIISLLFWTSCSSEKEDYVPIVENAKLEFTVPANFPEPSYNVTLNPPTEKGFELGKKLFYDGRLASDGEFLVGFATYKILHLPTIHIL